MTQPARPIPWHLVPVGVIAVAFNAVGVYNFVVLKLDRAAAGIGTSLTPVQVAHYQAMPAWATVIWAMGVLTALLGSGLLLLRRRRAVPFFDLALAAFLVNLAYNYGFTDGLRVLGWSSVAASLVVIGLLVFFIGYARWLVRRGLLR